MPQATARSLVDGAIELFSLPDIYDQISRLLNDPRVSVKTLGQVIAKDPALSIKLLKLVNSSFYGFQAKIDTISRAIVVVGINDLKNLLLATSVIGSFAKIPCDLIDMTVFWKRSIRCGVIARLLAKESLVLHCERLFLAGLLHDIGSLILYNKMPEESLKVLLAAENDRNRVAGLEQQIIGFNHAEVGGELIKSWGLPESLYESISCYIAPEVAHVHKFDAYLVSLSAYLVNALEQGLVPEDIISSLDLSRFSLIRLQNEQLLKIIITGEEEVTQLFELMVPKNDN